MTDTHEQLLDALEAAVAPEGADVDESRDILDQWVIDGARTAEWALRRRARARERIAEIEDLANAEINAIGERMNELMVPLERDVRYFEAKLTQYHHECLLADPRAKTVKLPGGNLKSTAGGVSLEVRDDAALVHWVEEHVDTPTELVAYEEKPRKAELKARFGDKIGTEPGEYPLVDAATGEKIPGVVAVRGERSFTVS